MDIIKNIIKEVKLQYAAPVYNLNNLNDLLDEEIQFIINDQLFSETLILSIGGKTKSYSIYKKN